MSAAHLSRMHVRFHRNMFTATEIPLAVCFFSGLLLQESASWKAHKKPSWAQKEPLWEEKTEKSLAKACGADLNCKAWPWPRKEQSVVVMVCEP